MVISRYSCSFRKTNMWLANSYVSHKNTLQQLRVAAALRLSEIAQNPIENKYVEKVFDVATVLQCCTHRKAATRDPEMCRLR